MKKTIPLLYTVALTTAFISCQKKENTETNTQEPTPKTFVLIEKASWLIGEWGNTSKEGVLTETWMKENDSTFHGKTYFITGKDTAFTESIQLMQKNGQLLYIPTVSDQNEGKSVSFILTTSTENQLVFENKEHDFPQKITYNKISTDSIVAEIYGIKDEIESKETYPMKKK
ncbi:DUF6265 family protein [Flavobacterium sp.]|uniref:DUF6265 family protein n=1 Tax=Flavobacterium sp. TaxID=239 RepID=UPI002B4B1E7B|nr:DUF6265 family protein [Flavobacterium sp.]HLF50912.1 DUF6265 family protein [Flavobacterium sp.]